MIEISDNGQGISEEHVNKIFDMFYRASLNSEGSGLGLYIVKEAIKILKGSITVQSELGSGTVFTIELPNLIHQSSF
ncbi:MAG: ATP-binding protein [Cytophagales bacterium]|nr:MAG: ATP-binding protein [Cytophagales bacterium]